MCIHGSAISFKVGRPDEAGMKRKHPKKCPYCGDDMEPVFPDEVGRSYSGCPLTKNPSVDPISWKCLNGCKAIEDAGML